MTTVWRCDWKPDELNPGPECPYCAGEMCGRFDGLGDCRHDVIERHGYRGRRAYADPVQRTAISLTYIDKLQRQNVDDLAFYPLTTLGKALEERHVISCEDNGEPAGYLWFGALRGGYDVTIYQAAVDYDSRRRHLGFGMVAELSALGLAAGCTGIRLKCASSAESNEFWIAAGFHCTRVQPGGIKRGRDLNCYRTDLQAGLFVLPTVKPSDRPIDLTAYNRQKREGVVMPSRFSRTHYKAPA